MLAVVAYSFENVLEVDILELLLPGSRDLSQNQVAQGILFAAFNFLLKRRDGMTGRSFVTDNITNK